MAELKGNENTTSWRKNADGTYNNKPSSPTYFKDYYNAKLAFKVECPLCGRIVGQQKLKLHQATRKCAKGALEKLSSSEERC